VIVFEEVMLKKESRAHKRQPSRLGHPCRLLHVTEEGPWLVTVRDISTDGVGLITDEPFRTGFLLTIELPMPGTGKFSVRLIRIRHSRKHPNSNSWTLGCEFVTPLSQIELESLRKKSPSLAPAKERRSRARHTTSLKAPCKVLRVTEEGSWLLSIRNVSATGIGLIADRPFKPGMVLAIRLPAKRRVKNELVRVVHVRKQTNNEWWILGCTFARKLTAEEIEALTCP
jgi:hypothetical protein